VTAAGKQLFDGTESGQLWKSPEYCTEVVYRFETQSFVSKLGLGCAYLFLRKGSQPWGRKIRDFPCSSYTTIGSEVITPIG
jgi:hypothetical protein